VKIDDVERRISLQRAKSASAVREKRFQNEWKGLLLEIISMLLYTIDTFCM
jgi:hypothetical protein